MKEAIRLETDMESLRALVVDAWAAEGVSQTAERWRNTKLPEDTQQLREHALEVLTPGYGTVSRLLALRVIVHQGGDVNGVVVGGRNGRQVMIPIGYAAARGDEALVRLLVNAGAAYNVECDDDGSVVEDGGPSTPVMLAVQEGHVDVVRVLIEAGIDLDHCAGAWSRWNWCQC